MSEREPKAPGAGLPLAGIAVVSTRPEHQSHGLAVLLEGLGAECVALPAIAIAPPREPARARHALDRLEDFDVVLFVSANAVEGLVRLAGAALAGRLRRAAVGAVGRATARALSARGLRPAIVPGRACRGRGGDSEALLASAGLAAAAVRGRRVLIVRGEGGRETLAEELSARGALVEYAEVYRRTSPPVDEARWRAVRRLREPLVVVITSGEGFHNLVRMLARLDGGSDWLRARQLLVVSERLARIVRAGDAALEPIVSDGAGDEAVRDAILAWARRRRRNPGG